VDLGQLREAAPRPFAIVQDDPDSSGDILVTGWGLQLIDGAIFAWCDTGADHRASVGAFASADSALWIAEMAGPARLVWMQSIEPSAKGAWIEASYKLVREIGRSPRRGRSLVLRIEPDQHTPGLTLVVVRERWDSTGLESSPLTTWERTAFGDTSHVLDWASERFGVDPAGWVTAIEDTENHHP
jgi:hypothetical protein